MPKRTVNYRAALLEDLANPTEAAEYLNAALEEESPESFLSALRDVAEARHMSRVAKDAGVAREALYRMLAPTGNPTYRNLLRIIRAVGLEFVGVRTAKSLPFGRPGHVSTDIDYQLDRAHPYGPFLVTDATRPREVSTSGALSPSRIGPTTTPSSDPGLRRVYAS